MIIISSVFLFCFVFQNLKIGILHMDSVQLVLMSMGYGQLVFV